MEPEQTQEQMKIDGIKNQLSEYGEANNLRGLEGRIQRGLDPAGMLAVKETRDKLEKVADVLGASMEDVIALTNELHTGAIWDKADELADGVNPAVKVWMVSAAATTSEKETEEDISEAEFIKDLERLNKLLDVAVEDPSKFSQEAQERLIEQSKEQFSVEDGVPISELDSGFLAMAVNGHKSGIVEQGGLMFVGSKELDFGVLEQMGLKEEVKEDRGREATFYVNDKGEDVAKKLYGGFAIVLNGDKNVAKALAETGAMEKNEKIMVKDYIKVDIDRRQAADIIQTQFPGYVEYDEKKHDVSDVDMKSVDLAEDFDDFKSDFNYIIVKE